MMTDLDWTWVNYILFDRAPASYDLQVTKQQVDTVKGVAITQVVILHFLALFPEIYWLHADFRAGALVVIDQLCRLSIPFFVFLSWYGLSKKYHGQPVHLFDFLKNRVAKLIPLYIIWAVGIWLYMQLIPSWRFTQEIPLHLKLFLGQSDYHLYFVPMIILLYILFCLYTYLPKILRILFLVPIGVLTVWWYGYLPVFRQQYSWIPPDQIQYLVPITWLWYAWFGGVAADFNFSHYLANSWVKRILFVLSSVTGFWAIMDAYQYTHGTVFHSVLSAMQFTRFPILVFATMSTLLLLSTVGHWGNEKNTLLSKIGVYSFFVYLAHTSLLRLGPAQYLHPIPIEQWLLGAAITALLMLFSAPFLL